VNEFESGMKTSDDKNSTMDAIPGGGTKFLGLNQEYGRGRGLEAAVKRRERGVGEREFPNRKCILTYYRGLVGKAGARMGIKRQEGGS